MFVVRCRHTGESVLIDAANEHERLLELCQRLDVRRVLETHGHWDHIGAVPQMREAGYEVAVTSQDAPMLKDVGYDVFLDDAEVIEVGRLRLHAIHNPGHTPGSISFLVEGSPVLFSGDTLFPGGPGNTSFEGGDFATIIDSLDNRAVHPAGPHRGDAGPRRRHHHRQRATAPRRVGRAWLVATPITDSSATATPSPTLGTHARRTCAHARPASTSSRLVLAFLVLVSHTWPLGGFGAEPSSPLTPRYLTLGGFAVAGFFGLSGMLVGRSALHPVRPGRTRGLASLRIVPAYWMALRRRRVRRRRRSAGSTPTASLAGFLTLEPGGPVTHVLRGALFPLEFSYGVDDVFVTDTPVRPGHRRRASSTDRCGRCRTRCAATWSSACVAVVARRYGGRRTVTVALDR